MRSAFRQLMLGELAMPRAQFAFEDEAFEPKIGVPFYEELVREIDATRRAGGAGGAEEHTILASVTLVYPSGGGTLPLESMAGRLKVAFKVGRYLTYGDSAGQITKSSLGANVIEAPWTRNPFTVRLRCWTSD